LIRLVFLIVCLVAVMTESHAQSDRPTLDISIKTFAMNLPEDARLQQQADIYPAVRQAESRYLPSFLKLILQDSGFWGAIRLLPDVDSGAELQVSAAILKSDGSTLSLAVRAIDATGRIWADKTYSNSAVESVSLINPVLGTDPFLYLYSEINNDLGLFYSGLTSAQLNEIKAIATLRYAAALAPELFSPYLQSNEEGIYSLIRFPAENDPLLLRVQEIREHEYVFIDVVDEQYEDFFVGIKPVYDLWRRYRREQLSSEEDKINRELRQGVSFRRGSFMSLKESYNNFRWSRMQDQFLDEINEGFINEVLPTDITLEDSLYHLSGTMDEQYQEWQEILKEFWLLDNSVTPQ
jgi:hypothetical protein